MKFEIDLDEDELATLLAVCIIARQRCEKEKAESIYAKTLPGLIKKLHGTVLVQYCMAVGRGKVILAGVLDSIAKNGFDKI